MSERQRVGVGLDGLCSGRTDMDTGAMLMHAANLLDKANIVLHIEFSDARHVFDPSDPVDRIELYSQGYSDKGISDAIATGYEFVARGAVDPLVRGPGGQVRANFTFYLGHDHTTVFHEIGHALDEAGFFAYGEAYSLESGDGGRARTSFALYRGHDATTPLHEAAHIFDEAGFFSGWQGTEEERTRYLSDLFAEGDEGEWFVRSVAWPTGPRRAGKCGCVLIRLRSIAHCGFSENPLAFRAT